MKRTIYESFVRYHLTKAMRSENLIEYSIKMRVESIISVTEKSDYYEIISVISCFTAFFPFRKFEFRGTKDSKMQYKI